MAKRGEKLYYSITEVSEIAGLKAHILRYWESEFPILHPKKNRAGNRIYREKDIDAVLLIKNLLYEEGYTIEGAKKKIKDAKREGKTVKKVSKKNIYLNTLKEIQKGLKEILEILNG
ncbi:MerR family transcriptional regulator [bacterium]|nr:MerR family transcriptional regulator [bacterium]